jgi:hypothetical protein
MWIVEDAECANRIVAAALTPKLNHARGIGALAEADPCVAPLASDVARRHAETTVGRVAAAQQLVATTRNPTQKPKCLASAWIAHPRVAEFATRGSNYPRQDSNLRPAVSAIPGLSAGPGLAHHPLGATSCFGRDGNGCRALVAGLLLGSHPLVSTPSDPLSPHIGSESPGPAWLGIARPTATTLGRRRWAEGSTEFTRFAPTGCPAGSLLNEGNRRSIRLSYGGDGSSGSQCTGSAPPSQHWASVLKAE